MTPLKRLLTYRLAATESRVRFLEQRIAHLESLVEIGTNRLDQHLVRLNTLEDDLENLK